MNAHKKEKGVLFFKYRLKFMFSVYFLPLIIKIKMGSK